MIEQYGITYLFIFVAVAAFLAGLVVGGYYKHLVDKEKMMSDLVDKVDRMMVDHDHTPSTNDQLWWSDDA